MLIRINFDLGKNGHHRPSGLGRSSVIVVRQQNKTVAVDKFFLSLTTSVIKHVYAVRIDSQC